MSDIVFKLSDTDKRDLLWNLLNPIDEEGNRTFKYWICAVYDEYVVAQNEETRTYERIYYTKNDETNELSIEKREACFIVDVNEEELKAISNLKDRNGGTYIALNENFVEVTELNSKISEKDTKIEELVNSNSTLTVDKSNLENSLTELQGQLDTVNEQFTASQETIANLNKECAELNSYKKNIEDGYKKVVINNYVKFLAEDVINNYMSNMDKYSAEELDMRLTYELKKNHSGCFSSEDGLQIPKVETKYGIEAILSKY